MFIFIKMQSVITRTLVGKNIFFKKNFLRCMSSNSFIIHDPKEFENLVKKSKVPIVVDFFATWCAPCRALAPRLETVIEENAGSVKLAKVDIDENTDLALDYKVGSIPVLIAMRNGKVEERLEGLQDTDKIRKFVEKLIERERRENEASSISAKNK